jgi:tetratricopeptide (TPR) repeat protein
MTSRASLILVALLALCWGCGDSSEEALARLRTELHESQEAARDLGAEKEALSSQVSKLQAEAGRLEAERDALAAALSAASSPPAPPPQPSKQAEELQPEPALPHDPPPAAPSAPPSLEANQQTEARERLADLGAILFERGDYGVAQSVLLSACQLGADDPRLIFRIGYCKAASGDYEGATQWYERARKALEGPPTPDDALLAACFNNLGVMAERLDKPQEAADFYRRAIALDERYTPALFNLGLLCATNLDRREEALEALRKHVIHGGERSASARKLLERLTAPAEAGTAALPPSAGQ